MSRSPLARDDATLLVVSGLAPPILRLFGHECQRLAAPWDYDCCGAYFAHRLETAARSETWPKNRSMTFSVA